MEIKLGSEKRRIVITLQDLGKFLISVLYGMVQYLLHILTDNLEKVFIRKKWVSVKYFELAGLINSYITALDAKDSNIQRERLIKFRDNACIVLKNYRWRVYRRYKKVNLQPDSMVEFPHNMYRVALLVYAELKQMRRAHNSITHTRLLLRDFTTRFFTGQTN
jgi:hypothetical protein